MSRQIDAGEDAVLITDANATHSKCRGVWIGTTQSYDFYFAGRTNGWVTFKGCTAGTLLPLQVIGARITSGAASPASGDIAFVY